MGQCCCRRGRRPGDEESCPEKGGEKEVSFTSCSVCKSHLCNCSVHILALLQCCG